MMSELQMLLRRIEEIQTGERYIERVIGEHIDQPLARLLGRLGSGRRREIPQHTEPPFTDHPFGDFRHDAKHAGNAALIIVDRTVRKGVISLLGKTIALEEERQAFIPRRTPLLEDPVNAGTDVRPDLLPNLVRTGAEYPVALHADGG